MKNNASLVYGFLLVVGDFLALIAAFASAYVLRVRFDTRPLLIQGLSGEDYLISLAYLIPFWLMLFGFLGLYSKNVFENRFSEFGRLVVGSFVGMLFLVGYGYVTETDVFPTRLITLYALIMAFLYVLLFRTIARAVRRSMFSFGAGVSNVLIIGDSPITKEFIRSLSDTKTSGHRIVGVVGSKSMGKEYQHFSSFDSAVKALENIGINSIIQTELYSDPLKNSQVLAYAQQRHVSYRFVPGNGELLSGSVEIDLFNSIPVVAVHQTALVGWGRVVKRLFDLVVSALAIVIFSPLIALIAIISKATEPRGNVIFKQVRLTRYNREFYVYKFRTNKLAYSGLLAEEAFGKMGRPDLLKKYRENGNTLDNDPRNTKLGNFLRSTSLDELPQLWNVFKGDISLVGPRALVPRELNEYEKRHAILSVKSGLTGLAQISGRSDISFEERRRLDIYYVQNWSFWNDIVIILRTVSVVLFHRGAR